MRIGIVAAITAVLFATNALATDANAPLAPGKPAGLKQAQDKNDNTVMYIVGGAAIIAGIAILASSNNGGNTGNNQSSTPASSGTP